jgi:hypothetical protein
MIGLCNGLLQLLIPKAKVAILTLARVISLNIEAFCSERYSVPELKDML